MTGAGMSRRKPGGWAIAPAAILAIAWVLTACAPREAAAPTAVAGGHSPAMPPLPAAQAHIEPAALEAAAIAAREDGADALLVARNGHIVFERYWHDTAFGTPTEAGGWQGIIDDLLAGALVNDHKAIQLDATPDRARIALAAGVSYEAYLAKRLWRPIGAADAVLAPDLRAAQGDWIRVGELLANDGVYMGEEIVRPGWSQRVLARHAATGEVASLGSIKDLHRLPGAGGASLWIVPSLRLVILRTGRAETPGDPSGNGRIADFVLRGVTDRPDAMSDEGATDPARWVPRH